MIDFAGNLKMNLHDKARSYLSIQGYTTCNITCEIRKLSTLGV